MNTPFEESLEIMFRRQGLDFVRHPALGGIEPDFLVIRADGCLIVVEAKSGERYKRDLKPGMELAQRLRTATSADYAFVVVDGIDHGDPEKGVVARADLIEVLRGAINPRLYYSQPHFSPKVSGKAGRTIIFAAMPFSPEYDDVYYVAMAPAAEAVGAVCKRVDKDEFVGDIVSEIKRLIGASVGVFVDLSESRPDVLYEAGYAHALGRACVHLCCTPLEGLPFDVRNWNTMKYRKGQTHSLRDALIRRTLSVILR